MLLYCEKGLWDCLDVSSLLRAGAIGIRLDLGLGSSLCTRNGIGKIRFTC